MRGTRKPSSINQSVGSWRVEVVELPFRLWNANRKKPSQVSFPRGTEHDRLCLERLQRGRACPGASLLIKLVGEMRPNQFADRICSMVSFRCRGDKAGGCSRRMHLGRLVNGGAPSRLQRTLHVMAQLEVRTLVSFGLPCLSGQASPPSI